MGKVGKIIKTGLVLTALATTQVDDVNAQTLSVVDSSTPTTEKVAKVLQLNPEDVKSDSAAMQPKTIDFVTAQEFGGEQGQEEGGPAIEPDPGEGGKNEKGNAGAESQESKESQGNKPGIRIGYNVGVGSNTFAPGTGSVLGNRPSFSGSVNASLNGVSLGVSRITDFDLNNPKSNFTQMLVSYNKKIGLSDNWNIYVGATGGYVHFDHSFNVADYGNVKLNEMMGMAQFSLKGKVFSVGLGVLYNFFLNGVTPNNLVTKLEAGVDFNGTSLIGESRLTINEKGQKSLSAAIGLKQQLPEGFSLYLRALAANINMLNGSDNELTPQMIFSVSKNGIFSGKLFSKKRSK